MGGKNLKSVIHYKYLGVVLDTELSDDKDIQRQLRQKFCAANKLRACFSRCSNAVKNVHFRSFCTPCMHRNYGVISGSHACKDCVCRVAYNFGYKALYNLPWRRSASSHDSFNVTFLHLRHYLRKNMHLFLERCRRSNNVMVACFDAVRLFIFFFIL